MNNRLKQFLAVENISQSQFADSINIVRATVSHVLSGRNYPSYDFLKALMTRYPRLNIEWLMFGKGKMYKEPAISEQPRDDASLFDDIPQESTLMDKKFPTTENSIENIKSSNDNTTLTKSSEKSVNQRNISKIVIFFDDGTFQEF